MFVLARAIIAVDHIRTAYRRDARKMGRFCVKCKIENPIDRPRSAILARVLVDTGSEFTWISEKTLDRIGIKQEKKDVGFVLANGTQVTRNVGFAIIRLDKYFTIDEVVFAEPGDLTLLGARTLEGLNLTVDPGRRRLVAAGPLPAALSASPRPARERPRRRSVICSRKKAFPFAPCR
jgi:predicted aspartyl protease